MFTGSFVALITPLTKDGQVDEKKLAELVEWHLSEGTNGIVPVGTTGESATLSHEEHAQVIDIVVKAVNKRVPVIAGAGSNSTREAISLTQEAKDLGVDAVLSVCPYYNKPTQEGLLAHFTAIAKAVDIPIILYNIPSRTNVNLSPESTEILAKMNKNIVGVKEATGSMEQAAEIIHRLGEKFSVLSGEDGLTQPLMSLGAKGVISVAANIVPRDVKKLCDLSLNGKDDEAKEIHLRLSPLVKALFLETNPSPVKAAMAELGLIKNDNLRLPLVSVRPDTRKEIKNAIKSYGVKIASGVKS